MSDFFEIAYAAVSKRLCLFVGTGFSMAVTNNKAPSWQGLLESVCNQSDNPEELKSALFPADGKNPLSLEEAAQIISIELHKNNKNIYKEIAAIIEPLNLKGYIEPISNFMSTKSFKVITTNYDKLVELISGGQDCHSLTPGLPIPRSQSRVKVYHVHGSIDSPENMVITSDDYFKFINSESYFSRKLSTVLHENTIVILGYSLGDTNLKAIISEYKEFSRSHAIGSNIFFISRSAIDQHVKDYYSHCYGIRVLDDIDVCSFFQQLNVAIPMAEKCAEASVTNIKNVIFRNYVFNNEYLKIENSFFEIISSIGAVGLSINDPRVVTAIGKVIESKILLTNIPNAWEQYVHLAKWLIYLASILELEGATIEDTFLQATLQSMNTMRSEQYIGYSWHAYGVWNNQWHSVIASNRALIRKYIKANNPSPDALAIVRRG